MSSDKSVLPVPVPEPAFRVNFDEETGWYIDVTAYDHDFAQPHAFAPEGLTNLTHHQLTQHAIQFINQCQNNNHMHMHNSKHHVIDNTMQGYEVGSSNSNSSSRRSGAEDVRTKNNELSIRILPLAAEHS